MERGLHTAQGSRAPFTWAQAAALYDLTSFGVTFDLATPGLTPAAPSPENKPESKSFSPSTPSLQQSLAKPDALLPTPASQVPSPDLRIPTVWTQGEPNGLTIVLKGTSAPTGPALELLHAILAAVPTTLPLAFVGAPLMGFKVHPDVAQNLTAAVTALAPQRLLVLGQDMVNHLAGKPVGIEGWQTAPTPLAGLPPTAITVTYPLDLLLQRPLYKRLVWLALQPWRIPTA